MKELVQLWRAIRRPETWLVTLMVLVAIFCLLAPKIFAGGVSQFGYNAPITLRHHTEMDSARVYFGFPDGGNFYATRKLLPLDSDSTIVRADSVSLDSAGTHYVTIEWYERGAGSVSGTDSFFTWTNVLGRNVAGPPAAASSPDYVAAYIDITGGLVDTGSGNMIPRTGIELFLNLSSEGAILYDSGWAYVPQTYRKRPDATGRCIFYVPVNRVLYPLGSYYILTYESRDGRTRSSGEIRKFILDTIPDPAKIMEATQVW